MAVSKTKPKTKPYTAAEKRIIHQLGIALVCAEIEANVIKPATEKETGKPYKSIGGYLDVYLKSEPKVKRAWDALQKEVQTIRTDYLAYSKAEKKAESASND